MPLTSLLLGQVVHGGLTITTDVPGGANGAVQSTVPDELYLHDSTASRSMLDQLAVNILADNSDVTPSIDIFIGRDRRIRFNSDVDVDITLSAALAEILGFTSTSLTGTSTYTANNPSPYLWAPGLTEMTAGRLGMTGIPVWDAQWSMGGGMQPPKVTRHNFHRRDTLEWKSVAKSRVWATEIGGEHFAFWRDVLMAGRRFCHYRQVSMDEASGSEVTLANRVGPFCMAPQQGRVEYPYVRVIESAEHRNNVSIPVVLVTEIT